MVHVLHNVCWTFAKHLIAHKISVRIIKIYKIHYKKRKEQEDNEVVLINFLSGELICHPRQRPTLKEIAN